jgi:predicted N-acetyltransferase YhbS
MRRSWHEPIKSIMQFVSLTPDNAAEIEAFFVSVFSASEGEAEGVLIGKLAKQLAADLDDKEVLGFAALDQKQMIGAVYFSRLTFNQPTDAFILAPMGVATAHQGTGVGQGLIRHGLEELSAMGSRLVMTYGDPAFYNKVGFRTISPDVIRPPYPLSQPAGWLGQPLADQPLQAFSGHASCAKPLDDPVYW